MRILSLDLDFFLNRVKLGAGTGRLSDGEYRPWSPWAVRRFLEDGCGLSLQRPVRGRVGIHHHELFHWWNQLLASGDLVAPFDVVHVDAHADLGMGDGAFLEIIGELTHLPLPERPARITQLEEGNFLAYAGVCGWLANLTYVTHPEWKGRDLHFMHFDDYDDRSGRMEFKRIDPAILKREVDRYNCYIRPYERDVCLPFAAQPGASFCDALGTWDFVFVCQSPEYTPPAADTLLPVITEYLAATT